MKYVSDCSVFRNGIIQPKFVVTITNMLVALDCFAALWSACCRFDTFPIFILFSFFEVASTYCSLFYNYEMSCNSLIKYMIITVQFFLSCFSFAIYDLDRQKGLCACKTFMSVPPEPKFRKMVIVIL